MLITQRGFLVLLNISSRDKSSSKYDFFNYFQLFQLFLLCLILNYYVYFNYSFLAQNILQLLRLFQ
jgi:hypothetical protein